MRKRYIGVILVALFLISVGILIQPASNVLDTLRANTLSGDELKNQSHILIADTVVTLERAETPKDRAKGLSNRTHLKENHGMIFIFEEDGFHSIWMKDTLIPLDILWLTNEGEIVHIEEEVQPSSYPTTFTSTTPARYVIELNATVSRRLGLSVGSRINLDTI